MNALAYTDASHCHITGLSACSFAVLVDGRMIKHEVVLIANCNRSGDAEVYAACLALQYSFLLPGVKRIQLNTDYLPLTWIRRTRRDKKHQNTAEFLDTLEIIQDHGIVLSISHVKAHGNDKINNLVDKSSRTQLRKYLKDKR